MQMGVQHRNIYLVPMAGLDRHWFIRSFAVPEIYTMFGYDAPAMVPMGARLATNELVVGIIRRVADRARIGFVVAYPPTDVAPFWELGYAITEARDRNAFTAMHSLDAMGYYMREHHGGVSLLGGRTRHDNRQAEAVVRRMGFKPLTQLEHLGHAYNVIAQDPAAWEKRKAKLAAAETASPSPAGEAFVFLRGPPFEPIGAPARTP